MNPVATRMIALGSAPLMEGFALIGFETHPDADAATLERVLEALVHENARALVLLEQHLARTNGPWLTRLRESGGQVVITEIPALHEPAAYHPPVEDLVRAILGPAALEDRT